MIVPQYWAEASARHRDAQQQLTLRRFGWSDQSQADFPDKPPLRWTLWVMAALFPLALWGGRWLGAKGWTVVLVLLALLFSGVVAKGLFSAWLRAAGGAEQQARQRAQAYANAHSESHDALCRATQDQPLA